MNTQQTAAESPLTPLPAPPVQAAAPSAEFIQAISRFLDTDPDDLLLELGYYSREEGAASGI